MVSLVGAGIGVGTLADASIKCSCPLDEMLGCWPDVKGSDGVDRVSLKS